MAVVAGLWWEHEFLETQVRVAVKIRTVLWQEHDLGRRTREGLWQADDVAQWREQPFELRQMATPGGLKKEARQDCDFRPKTPQTTQGITRHCTRAKFVSTTGSTGFCDFGKPSEDAGGTADRKACSCLWHGNSMQNYASLHSFCLRYHGSVIV